MSESLLLALTLMPIIVGAVGTGIAWKRINSRFLFLVTSCLSLLGIQAVLSPAAMATFLPGGAGIGSAAVHEGFVQAVQASAILVIVAGSPLIWALSRVFRRA